MLTRRLSIGNPNYLGRLLPRERAGIVDDSKNRFPTLYYK